MKTYWQAMDSDGKVYLFYNEKPTCDDGEYYSCHSGEYIAGITFPIPLKPLQIATITVHENGTWSWEIEREEGWYMAKMKSGDFRNLYLYRGGEWFSHDNTKVELKSFTISTTRIPDECII